MSARDDVRAAVAAVGAPIPFADAMAIALYGEHGFYEGDGGGAGRRGDFITSPEVGPLFGTVMARFLDAQWVGLGRPDPFTVIDAGAGPGTLARSIRAAEPACARAMRYVAVEVSVGQRTRHPAGIESRADLPPGPLAGVIVANELLDNLPFRLVVFDGAWREACVDVTRDGDVVEVLSAPLDPLPRVLPAVAPHGARAPLVDAAAAWVESAMHALGRGSLVVIDYTRTTTEEFVATPWRSWLRTYRGHERGGHYLAALGHQDVTVDVPLDQLVPPERVSTQADFLRRWGLDDLVADGRRAWVQAAATPDLAALAGRSRGVEAEALIDPGGLGGFTVMQWSV